jgi:anti-sigma B factor antagonist
MQDSMTIEERPGSKPGHVILTLNGPLLLATVFGFQSAVRADKSQALIIDFSKVPYVDSAGIGALVGACVTRQNSNRQLALVGANDRVRTTLQVTHVEQFFKFFGSIDEAESTF